MFSYTGFIRISDNCQDFPADLFKYKFKCTRIPVDRCTMNVWRQMNSYANRQMYSKADRLRNLTVFGQKFNAADLKCVKTDGHKCARQMHSNIHRPLFPRLKITFKNGNQINLLYNIYRYSPLMLKTNVNLILPFLIRSKTALTHPHCGI